MTEIRVERSKLYPCVARRGPAWKWSYNYFVDGGPVCQYGPGLADLRSMLKRRFPSARIVWTWEANA